MKFALIGLALSMPVANAQVVIDYPMRAFGSNVYDFSAVMESVQRGEAKQLVYMVVGRVSKAGDGWAEIIRKKPDAPVRMSEEWQRNFLLAGPAEQMRRLYAQEVIKQMQKGEVSAGEYNAMDAEMKGLVYEGSRQVKPDADKDYVRVFVTNCPAAYCIPEKEVRFFAMPVTGGTASVPHYDYGKPFVGNRGSNNTFLVTIQGITRMATPEEAGTKKAAATARLIAWQREQASNGVAYVQYDLARRYLDGNGVTKDDSVGRFWLGRSAAQNYEPAQKLLEALGR